jgi:protein arginine N-methyltransferase 5
MDEVTFTQEDIQEMINEGNGYKREYLSFGLYYPNAEVLEDMMNSGAKYQFDFVVGNIFNSSGTHNITTTEYITNSEAWSNTLVGIVTKNDILKQIELANYLGLPAVQISLGNNLVELSHTLHKHLDSMNACWIHVRHDQWKEWNYVRNVCDSHPKLHVILEVPVDLPDDPWDIQRWRSEPLKAILLSSDMFYLNTESQLTTTQKHLRVLEGFFDFPVQVVLKGNLTDWTALKNYCTEVYYTRDYPDHEESCKAFNDVLQTPLQPLMHNLESSTYEVFEKDPVKYDEYELAIYQAVMDQPEKDVILIYCLGAGRGGLVKRAIRASRKSKRKTRIMAIEKNQNAINILLHFKKIIWEENVEIVHSDMRDFEGSPGDIIVSELLGSFGDNELSPECLDGAKHLCHKYTVFIPRDYTSYCALLSSTKFHKNVKAFNSKSSFEIPYVVRVHQFNLLSEIKECWQFTHPNPLKSNDRFTSLEFTVKNDGPIHGIIGYFESKLYKDVWLSIHPENNEKLNPGMFSWFPLVFPIHTPVFVRKNEKIVLNLWRCSDKYKVWYEWNITGDNIQLYTHNINGRSSWIGIL